MSTRDLIIRSARIWQGHGTDPIEGDLRIADGVIVEVGQVGPVGGGSDVPEVDARGGTVIPGLIDAHFHAYATTLDSIAQEAQAMSLTAIHASRRLGAALRRGFTTVRDPAGGERGLGRAIEEGLIASPRYLYTGPALSQTGGHGDAVPGDLNICLHSHHIGRVVDGVDEIRKAVRENFRQGATAVKLMTSGGVFSPSDPLELPQFSGEEIRAAVDEATRRDSYVAAHSYTPASIRHSLVHGVRTIEHGNLLDAATAELMAEHGAYLDPTLATYDAMDRVGPALGLPSFAIEKNRLVLDAGRIAIEHCLAAGVPVGFGTDLLAEMESEQLTGLRLQAEVMGTGPTIDAATRVNADLIGRPDLGRLEVGAPGDAVVFEVDPLEHPEVLWDAERRTVVQAGRVVR